MSKRLSLFILCVTIACSGSPKVSTSNPIEEETPTFPSAWTPTPQPTSRPTATNQEVAPTPTETLPISGCNPKYITGKVVHFAVPSISPDGEWLVFTCGSYSEGRVCKIMTDGTSFEEITRLGPGPSDPKWSPTEDMIAVVRESSKDQYGSPIMDIYLISPGGDVIDQLTNDPTSVGKSLGDIQWAPDGQRIAFLSTGEIGSENSDVYVVNVDGSNLNRLTSPPAAHASPRWSHDGRHLAYLAISPSVTYLVIDAEPWNQAAKRQIPLQGVADLSWMPDGSGFIYWSVRDDNYDLFTYDLESEEESRLTTGLGVDVEPVWSADGSILLFRSNRSGHHEIYTMDESGNNIMRQAANLTDDFTINPFWSMDSETIFFFLSNHLDELYELWSVNVVEMCGAQ